MNIEGNERFHELAHKALANDTQPAEQAELKAFIAENPKLKEEFEQMEQESAAAREILPLLEDIQHPRSGVPQPPMRRLQQEVRDVFEPRSESKKELYELLAKLEKWADKQIGAERERVVEWISMLSRSFVAGPPEPLFTKVPPSLTESLRMLRSSEKTTLEAAGGKTEEAKYRQAVFEKRLRSLEERIRQAEQITQYCREEVQGLLEELEREREISEQRQTQNPSPSTEE